MNGLILKNEKKAWRLTSTSNKRKTISKQIRDAKIK